MCSVDNNKNIIMTKLFVLSFIFALIIICIIFLVGIWYNSQLDKRWKKEMQKYADKASSTFTAQIASAINQYKAGPWYLVVYTMDTPYPLWISNNNIRSVHPDEEHNKIIVKQFNGEDMVIENMDRYELCSANEMYDYDM